MSGSDSRPGAPQRPANGWPVRVQAPGNTPSLDGMKPVCGGGYRFKKPRVSLFDTKFAKEVGSVHFTPTSQVTFGARLR